MVVFLAQKNTVTKMNIKEKIISECSKNISREICGFVIKTKEGFDVITMDNKSTQPDREFYIPAKEFLYVKRNNEIVAKG